MSWLSELIHGSSADRDAAISARNRAIAQQREANRLAAEALADQQRAAQQAAEAAGAQAVSLTGTERTRRAAERRLKALYSSLGTRAFAFAPAGAAPVSYKVAFGE